MKTEELLATREETHGQFSQNAIYAQELRSLFRGSPRWPQIPPVQREALDMMATKLSRILSGQADYAEHFLDIEGYARLAREACTR